MKILDSTEIEVPRNEANFDRACDMAHRLALNYFEITKEGHSHKVIGWERSTCSVVIEFNKYERIGSNHTYTFEAKAVRG